MEIQLLDGYLGVAALLGRRTAELHAALAKSDDPAFKPEPYTRLYQRSLYQSMRNTIRRPLQTLQTNVSKLEGETRPLAEALLARRDELMARIARVKEQKIDAMRIRCHGDYHLGQVLWTGCDFMIIDFEGEPTRPLGERRLKRTCLSDVAGMLRSIQYVAEGGLRELVSRGTIDRTAAEYPRFAQWADFWRLSAEADFLRGYLSAVDPKLIPADVDGFNLLLDAWLLQKAAYEVGYELNSRPDWLDIPLRGILKLLDAPPSLRSS